MNTIIAFWAVALLVVSFLFSVRGFCALIRSLVLLPPEIPVEDRAHVFYTWCPSTCTVHYRVKIGTTPPPKMEWEWWRMTKNGFVMLSDAKCIAEQRERDHGECVNGKVYAVSYPTPRTSMFE